MKKLEESFQLNPQMNKNLEKYLTMFKKSLLKIDEVRFE